MNYTMYKLEFPNGVHLGTNSLEDSRYSFSADTLFSALYIEAMKMDLADEFYEKVMEGKILLSDAFPYIGDTCYIPKPMTRTNNNSEGNSSLKKALKGLPYIPMKKMKDYINGTLDAVYEKDVLETLGKSYLKTSASIYTMEETEPYHIGVYSFYEGNGLYFILGTETDDEFYLVFDILESLSFSGIGGKKSAGLGRFEIKKQIVMKSELFEKETDLSMTLSISLPTEEELKTVLDGASYQLVKRSGFVYSENYADEQLKKKDLYMISSGACFSKRFAGDVFDVSNEGRHPVYRYGRPIFFSI